MLTHCGLREPNASCPSNWLPCVVRVVYHAIRYTQFAAVRHVFAFRKGGKHFDCSQMSGPHLKICQPKTPIEAIHRK